MKLGVTSLRSLRKAVLCTCFRLECMSESQETKVHARSPGGPHSSRRRQRTSTDFCYRTKRGCLGRLPWKSDKNHTPRETRGMFLQERVVLVTVTDVQIARWHFSEVMENPIKREKLLKFCRVVVKKRRKLNRS
ncbi:hypothetical protein EVAR_41390_1 [Eumeta japonica]|uniref:Uncharacterized protein n=1 Tax=Eumeta variegata TaxID=151549 RepID=A0A4C1X1H0_EUMVA|nr:hypothetical protein EVAR_41390_1 [Eumeta japonica]